MVRRLVPFVLAVSAFVIAQSGPQAAADDSRSCLFCPPPTTTPTTAAPAPPPASPTTTPPSVNVSNDTPVAGTPFEAPGAAEQLLALINAERAKVGVRPLAGHAPARAVALAWSKVMQENRMISHNDAYFSSSTRSALGAGVLGENVAMDNRIADAHDHLMQSEHHRDNILDPRFNAVGLGVMTDGTGILYITEDFLQSLRPATAAPAAAAPARVARAAAPRPAVRATPRTTPPTTARPAPTIIIEAPSTTTTTSPATVDTTPAATEPAEGDNPAAATAGVILAGVVAAMGVHPFGARRLLRRLVD